MNHKQINSNSENRYKSWNRGKYREHTDLQTINPLPISPPGILLKINFRYVPDAASSTERTPKGWSVVLMGSTMFAEIFYGIYFHILYMYIYIYRHIPVNQTLSINNPKCWSIWPDLSHSPHGSFWQIQSLCHRPQAISSILYQHVSILS